jgi:hypothetical protein
MNRCAMIDVVKASRAFLCSMIASTTSEPSRVTNSRHSVQPVATSTIVSVWMNEAAAFPFSWSDQLESNKGSRWPT